MKKEEIISLVKTKIAANKNESFLNQMERKLKTKSKEDILSEMMGLTKAILTNKPVAFSTIRDFMKGKIDFTDEE